MQVPPQGVGDLGKFLLPPPPLQSNSFFFSRIVCWNLSLGKLDFCKFSFIQGMDIYPGQHSPGFFLTVLREVWAGLLAPRFHSLYQGLSAYY